MSVVLAIITAAVAAYILIYYNVFRGARCRSKAILNGRTVVVTGELLKHFIYKFHEMQIL